MKRFFLIILLCFSTICQAEDFALWTQEQKNWYIASNIMLALDWRTTHDMSRRWNEGYREFNPLLGKTPSTSRVNNYFVGYFLANYVIASSLSGENRTLYLKGITTLELMAVGNNLALGLRVRF